MKIKITLILWAAILLSSCAVVRPGEVGIKQRLGKLSDQVVTQGTVMYNPLTTRIVKESTQTQNIKLNLTLPSKEGLSVYFRGYDHIYNY